VDGSGDTKMKMKGEGLMILGEGIVATLSDKMPWRLVVRYYEVVIETVDGSTAKMYQGAGTPLFPVFDQLHSLFVTSKQAFFS
jgi:hypothetical protein